MEGRKKRRKILFVNDFPNTEMKEKGTMIERSFMTSNTEIKGRKEQSKIVFTTFQIHILEGRVKHERDGLYMFLV